MGLVDQLANSGLFGHERVRPGLELCNAALQIPALQPGCSIGFRTGALERLERAGELGADGLFAGDQFLTAHGSPARAGRSCASASSKASASFSSL